MKEKLTNDSEGNKLKWDPQTRMLLMNTCLDKEVWTARHGGKPEGKSFQDVCTILEVILDDKANFETITWCKSQAEFEANLKLHNTRNWFPSNPEQVNHFKWHAAQQSN